MNIEVEGKLLEVVIVRKKIKNLYIRVKDEKVIVSCNNLVSLSHIKDLLQQNKKDIIKMYEQDKKKRVEQEDVYFLGDKLNYSYDKENLKIDTLNGTCSGPSIAMVNAVLEKKSLPIFEKRLRVLMNMFDDLPKFRLRTRKMKTRWGVCNKSSMTVTLNTDLIHKEVHLIDYVIIHELCHFKYMDHSKLFWKEVEKYYPYYKEARRQLR